ncbi:MAG: response regulator transcription factor [Balneolaceae bacterium]
MKNLPANEKAPEISIFFLAGKDKPAKDSNPVSESSAKGKMKQQIRILLVDDHQMTRRGLKTLIEDQGDQTVIAEATTGREAVKLALETKPEIILMDINLPGGMNGIEATKIITSNKELKARVIGLSFHDEASVMQAMKRAGASAYLSKTEAMESLVNLIRNEAMRI